MVWHFYWMNSSKAIASIHWRSSRHLLLCPGVLGLGTTRWVLFFLERTSAAKQAAKSRTKSTGDSQTIFALTLCFGELQTAAFSKNADCIFKNCSDVNLHFEKCSDCSFEKKNAVDGILPKEFFSFHTWLNIPATSLNCRFLKLWRHCLFLSEMTHWSTFPQLHSLH